EVVLILEFKRHVWRLEECQVRTVVQAVEGMQRARCPPGLAFADFQRADQRQAEKFLVELPSLFRVPAAVGAVVQFTDHAFLHLKALWSRVSSDRNHRLALE